MDFTGSTPSEASNILATFLRRTAETLHVPLNEQSTRHVVPRVTEGMEFLAETAKGFFYIEMNFHTDLYTDVLRRDNPSQKSFGGGAVTKRGGRITLDLRLDAANRFRWYGVPVGLTDTVKAIIPDPNGAPFPLTDEWLDDGLQFIAPEKG